MAKGRCRRWFVALIMWVLIPLVAAGLFLCGFQHQYEGRIYPGVIVGDQPVGGLTGQEVRSLLQRTDAGRVMPPLLLQVGPTLLPLSMAEIGYQVQVDRLAQQAMIQGRRGSLWQRLNDWAKLLWYGRKVPIKATYNDGVIALVIEKLAQRYARPVVEPLLIRTATHVTTYPGQDGVEINRAASMAAVEKALQSNNRGPVPVQVQVIKPQMPNLSALNRKTLINLNRPFSIHIRGVGDFVWDNALLAAASHIETRVGQDGQPMVRQQWDSTSLKQHLQNLAAAIDLPARDARLDYNPQTKKFIVMRPSQEGRKLEVDRALPVLLDALQQGKSEVTLSVTSLSPAVDMHASPADLGIVTLVGKGTTYFAGSSAARVHNLVKVAESLRGSVIPPNGIFSFTKYGEPVTAANGYEDSLIIWGDRTAVGIGGGVCQVSTTVFRAAFFSGMPIVERHNHGYIVGWYGKPGYDATIYLPNVDFKFKNATGHYLLLRPVVNTQRGILTIELYGTNPGWTVQVDKAVTSNVQPPLKSRYQEDKTLPKGSIRQVEWPQKGMTVQVRRIVRQGDKVLRDTTITSVYQPWGALYLYGPGTAVPGAGKKP